MSTDFVSLFTGMSERDIGYLLKNMVQKSINQELTNTEVSNVDEKTPVLITNSKDVELMNDISISSVINIEAPTTYTMTEEPDGVNMKLWLKFQNAGELRDWSYQKNKSYAVGANTMPGLFYKSESRNMLKNELYSYFNGISHYGYTVDSPTVRITPNITSNKITSFFMRLIPISLAKLLYAENNSLFTKVDDDQLRYGYSVTVDTKGSLHFYVKNNYKQYHLFVKDAYNSLVTNPIFLNSPIPYRFENFNPTNFSTNYETLCNIVDSQPAFDDWFFKYNPSNHNMSIIRTNVSTPATVIADTSLVTVNPYLSVPIQEGKYTHLGTVQTTLYDNSGNNNNGTINNIAVGGQWNDDNSLTSLGSNTAGNGGGMYVAFPTMATIDSVTEFTITFWYKPTSSINTKSYNTILVEKNFGNSSFDIYRMSGTSDLRFRYTNGTGTISSLTFPNAFPNPDSWYFVCVRAKINEPLEITINSNSITGATPTTLTTSGTLQLFDDNIADAGIMALFKLYTTKISTTVRDDLYYQGYHNPLFPKSENIQPEAGEEQPDIFIPFTNVYTLDKMTTPAAADYRKINSLAGNSALSTFYNVADGTSSVNPETNPYIVPDGVNTGGNQIPFSRIGAAPATIDSTANSTGSLGDGTNQVVGLWILPTAQNGIGDTINGKVITKAIFWMRKEDATVAGTLYCKIWDAAGVVKYTFTTTISANTLTETNGSASSYTPVEFLGTNNTIAMANEYTIGIEYTGFGSSQNVNVQRLASPSDPSAIQKTRDSTGDWDDDGNSGFSIKCDLYTGGTGSPIVEPWKVFTANSQIKSELIGSTSGLKGKAPTRVRFKMKRNASATAGTLTMQILTAASGYPVKTNGTLATWNISSLTTDAAGADVTWQNVNQPVTLETGEQLALVVTGMPANSQVSIMTNYGNNTTSDANKNHNSTTSYLRERTSGGTWSNDTSLDISGNIYTGGNNFDAYVRLSSTRTRIATKAVNNQSGLHNRKITKVTARIKKVGIPAGIITCRVRDPNDVQRVLYSSVDADTIPADGLYHDVVFENYLHTYLMNSATGSGDKIVYEFSGSSISNYLEFNTNKDVYDTANLATITQTYDNGNYVDDAQRDLAGLLQGGGEPDLNSRTRVAQSIEHQDSRLKGKKITRVQVWLYRTTTSTSGTVFCNIRRADDSLVKTLDSYPVSGLSSTVSVPSVRVFEDTTNNYPLGVGDKVSIEFNGGSSTEQVGVLVRNVTPNYDLSNSYIRKYDEADWDDVELDRDLCAIMDEGGFFFTPDPDAIPDPTPVNDKDLIFAAGNNKKSGFFEAFLMEFRIYSKNITLDNANNLFNNRYSISPIGSGEILMPFSFRAVTTNPV